MPQLLLELFSEEIPTRMQTRAAEDLRRLVLDGLKAQGLEPSEAHAYATPRRLVMIADGLAEKSAGVSEERKGPRVGAPEQATLGFLKAAGLASLEQAEIVKDAKKGDYYVARIERPGRALADIVAELVPAVCGKFPVRRTERRTRASRSSPSPSGSPRSSSITSNGSTAKAAQASANVPQASTA